MVAHPQNLCRNTNPNGEEKKSKMIKVNEARKAISMMMIQPPKIPETYPNSTEITVIDVKD